MLNALDGDFDARKSVFRPHAPQMKVIRPHVEVEPRGLRNALRPAANENEQHVAGYFLKVLNVGVYPGAGRL